jgi:hypothetical protein
MTAKVVPIRPEIEDPLAPAKGICNGLMISAFMWWIIFAIMGLIK